MDISDGGFGTGAGGTTRGIKPLIYSSIQVYPLGA